MFVFTVHCCNNYFCDGLHDNFAEFTKSEIYLFYIYIVIFINGINRFHGPLSVTSYGT